MYDGISLSSCMSGPGTTYTYTAGTAIGGLVEIFKLDKDKKHLELAHNITLAAFKQVTFLVEIYK